MKTNNLPKRLQLRITQEHIDAGKQCKCSECPIGLAAQEALGQFFDKDLVWVKGSGIISVINDFPIKIYDPINVDHENFVSNFDSKGRSGVSPCNIEYALVNN